MAAETLQRTKATIEDLYHIDGKAELVNGEIVSMAPTGGLPGIASDEIADALRDYAKETGTGIAVGDGKGFHVRLPNRESFSPDAAYIVGVVPTMRFYEGSPVFAVEIRNEWQYGPAAERDMAAKRADYFLAGTQVVWDVDLLAEEFIVKVYRSSDPANPTGYRRGEIAEAEPAVPGWTMSVDALFG